MKLQFLLMRKILTDMSCTSEVLQSCQELVFATSIAGCSCAVTECFQWKTQYSYYHKVIVNNIN